MGTFGEVLRGLGRFGSEAGTAAQGLAQERRRQLQDEFDRLNMRINYSDWQQRLKQAGVPQFRGTFQTPDGSLFAIETDPTTGEPSTRSLFKSTNKYPEFRNLEDAITWGITHNDQELTQKALETKEKLTKAATPSAASQEYADWRAAFVKRHGREPNDAEIRNFLRNPPTAGMVFTFPENILAALANKWQNEGVKPPPKFQAEVEQYMESKGMKPQVKLSQQERALAASTRQVQAKLTDLKKIIEDAGIANENSFVFGSHSALVQHLRRGGQYALGVKPEQLSADLFKAAAALQVMGAAPWVRIGRGRYTFDVIKQHLPAPTDTPALLYDKLNFLQSIVDEAQQSLPEGWESTFTQEAPKQKQSLDEILNQKFGAAPAPTKP